MDTWEISIFEYINKKKDEECCGLLTKQGNKTVFFSIRGSICGIKNFNTFGWPLKYSNDGGHFSPLFMM